MTTAANGATTYYQYDHLGNLTEKWSPVSVVDGNTLYSWTGYTYDKTGKVTTEKAGRSLVLKDVVPTDVYTKTYIYEHGLLKTQSDSEGRKAVYELQNL